MKTVQTTPTFAALSEAEVLCALEAYEALFGDEEDDEEEMAEEHVPEDPIVQEVLRLIGAYADKFDEYCEKATDFPAEVLEYEPESAIEQIAFEMFTDVLHDSLQEADDN